jgi:phage FluMu protein Com
LTGPNSMTRCYTCKYYGHEKCDLLLQNEEIKLKLLNQSETSLLKYSCPDCRFINRINIIITVIDLLENEDKSNYFKEESWNELGPQFKKQYLRKITDPMCFSIMRKQAKQYLLNSDTLESDVELIFTNAKTYYTKTNVQILKNIDKVQPKCMEILSKYKKTLQKYCSV